MFSEQPSQYVVCPWIPPLIKTTGEFLGANGPSVYRFPRYVYVNIVYANFVRVDLFGPWCVNGGEFKLVTTIRNTFWLLNNDHNEDGNDDIVYLGQPRRSNNPENELFGECGGGERSLRSGKRKPTGKRMCALNVRVGNKPLLTFNYPGSLTNVNTEGAPHKKLTDLEAVKTDNLRGLTGKLSDPRDFVVRSSRIIKKFREQVSQQTGGDNVISRPRRDGVKEDKSGAGVIVERAEADYLLLDCSPNIAVKNLPFERRGAVSREGEG
ncbi:hypothetical protein J6590_018093 [Homalodisca vitripennis]|nr:hypothetical protein J6590_018093 [Homalodisca vitripennis]